MTKNNIQVGVSTTDSKFRFINEHGTAALSAIRAHQDIHAMGKRRSGVDHDDEEQDYIIPYSAIDSAEWDMAQESTEVEDDNCKVMTPEPEVASIVIKNVDPYGPLDKIIITLSDTSINGTYSGVTFTNGVATIASGTIARGASMSIDGLPDGLEVTVTIGSTSPATESGVTPCTFELSNPSV